MIMNTAPVYVVRRIHDGYFLAFSVEGQAYWVNNLRAAERFYADAQSITNMRYATVEATTVHELVPGPGMTMTEFEDLGGGGGRERAMSKLTLTEQRVLGLTR